MRWTVTPMEKKEISQEQSYVYLILSSSSSLPAKLIKLVSKNKLNHSSISLDASLHSMYSFGRLKMYNPFYAGLVKEDKDKGFYKKFTDTYIKLYRLPVSKEVFDTTADYLEDVYLNRKSYHYNFLGVILLSFNISVAREKQYFCSEFVAKAVQDCSIRPIERNIHTFRPHFFEELPDIELIYDGMLADYSQESLILPAEETTAAYEYA